MSWQGVHACVRAWPQVDAPFTLDGGFWNAYIGDPTKLGEWVGGWALHDDDDGARGLSGQRCCVAHWHCVAPRGHARPRAPRLHAHRRMCSASAVVEADGMWVCGRGGGGKGRGCHRPPEEGLVLSGSWAACRCPGASECHHGPLDLHQQRHTAAGGRGPGRGPPAYATACMHAPSRGNQMGPSALR